MDFTREPIIETVITPKEGFKLVVRSSKSTAQEEYFVDSVEVVSFGYSFFFRSMERPKSFLVPVCDYEVLEVREARMVLKNVGIDKAIKIGGGREKPARQTREAAPVERVEAPVETEANLQAVEAVDGISETKTEGKVDKKKDRRRHYRRRRNREDGTVAKDGEESQDEAGEGSEREGRENNGNKPHEGEEGASDYVASPTSFVSSLLPPPPTLISETIARYKDNALFKGAFYTKEEVEERAKGDTESVTEVRLQRAEKDPEDFDLEQISLEESSYGSFESQEEAESAEDPELEHTNPSPSHDSSTAPHHEPDDHDHFVF